jgi:hypothetical protein
MQCAVYYTVLHTRVNYCLYLAIYTYCRVECHSNQYKDMESNDGIFEIIQNYVCILIDFEALLWAVLPLLSNAMCHSGLSRTTYSTVTN